VKGLPSSINPTVFIAEAPEGIDNGVQILPKNLLQRGAFAGICLETQPPFTNAYKVCRDTSVVVSALCCVLMDCNQLTILDTGFRPYRCKECQRTFSRQDSLVRHEKLHTRKDAPHNYPSPPSPPSSLISQSSLATSLSSFGLGTVNGESQHQTALKAKFLPHIENSIHRLKTCLMSLNRQISTLI
jgi:uncharacterized Zn-finger protein